MDNVHPNESSYVIDQESSVEMARLMELDVTTTKCMGSLFPSDIDLAGVHDILDIACGPGGWVLDVAFAHRDKRVVGVDISNSMLNYACAYADVQGLQNATFRYMDATSALDFPDASFDFINARFIVGFMWKEAWPQLIQECMRITRPGGFIRFTETDYPVANATNSVALSRLNRLAVRACWRTGRSFCEDEDGYQLGVTPMIQSFFKEAGYHTIREQPHALNYSAGADAHKSMSKNLQIAMKLVQPFLIKAGAATSDELDQVYQQMLIDLLREDFHSIWYFMSTYGQKAL
jgi:ubiquinone/menaquinone biosynthesis C-methylase UbiE